MSILRHFVTETRGCNHCTIHREQEVKVLHHFTINGSIVTVSIHKKNAVSLDPDLTPTFQPCQKQVEELIKN
jgi:hypothetical protein